MIARIGNIIGYLLMALGVCELLPVMIAYFYGETELILPFVISSLFTLFVGGALYLTFQSEKERPARREIILLLLLVWFSLTFFATLPFMVTGFLTSLTDAYFEATSALTTTGASLLINLDMASPTMLFWRSLLQWLGGILVFVMAVAILPLTSFGGINLFRSLLPHGEGDDLLARIRYAFAPLFKIYLGLTALCMILLSAFGMDGFNALLTAMATLSSGGFTSHGLYGVGVFDGWSKVILIPFMILAATNMTFHWSFLNRGRLAIYREDPEIFHFLYIMIAAAFIIFLGLALSADLQDVGLLKKAGLAIFTAVSTMTTTGFLPDHATSLPLAVTIVCMILLFIGGATGSTAGGFKILRVILLKRHADKEVNRLIYPNSAIPVTFNSMSVSGSVLVSVWALLFVFVTALAVTTILFSTLGHDMQTSAALSLTSLFSAGGLTPLFSPDFIGFHSLTPAGKWLASFTMILGRLEVIALLVFLMPSFWRN